MDDWLPSTLTAKWWHSALHTITAMVSATVPFLPYAMSHLGCKFFLAVTIYDHRGLYISSGVIIREREYMFEENHITRHKHFIFSGPGVVILVMSWVITLYTLWLMVQMHEIVPGKRFNRYHELGQHAFGQKLGLWIVVPQQLTVQIGLDIVYMIYGGTSIRKFYRVVCLTRKCWYPIYPKNTYFIIIFALINFVLFHFPNFNSIVGISLAATIMSLSYSIIAWATSLYEGRVEEVSYEGRVEEVSYELLNATNGAKALNFFSALGMVAFAYAGHSVALEIQGTIPSTPEKRSKGPMWRGVMVAYGVLAVIYFPMTIIEYWIYGNKVDYDCFASHSKYSYVIGIADLFVVIQCIGSYQIYAMPAFDMIETLLVKKMKFQATRTIRFIGRNIYVACTLFIAITFPFFDQILAFVGAFAFASTCYILPCIMWLMICKPERFGLSWTINWICIVLGVIIMVLSPIGALRQIIITAKYYSFYS